MATTTAGSSGEPTGALSGGPDLDPALYGAELEEGTDEPTPDRRVRDAFELALFRCARQRGLPVLGICRGLQLLNVSRGGTLCQHLPDRVDRGQQAAGEDIGLNEIGIGGIAAEQIVADRD